MPAIRRSQLIKKFTDFFRLKANDFLGSEVGRMIVPVVSIPINSNSVRVRFRPTEAQFCNGITVPAGKRWKIKDCTFNWNADVTGGNREIVLAVTEVDPITVTSTVFNLASRNFQIASTTVQYSFLRDTSHVGSSSGTFQTIPLPDLWLPERSIIFLFDNAGISAGDSISAATALIVDEEDMLQDEFIGRAVP